MTYIQAMEQQINTYDYGMPIFTKDLADGMMGDFSLSPKDAKLAVSVAMKRIIEKNIIPELRFFQKGIYYKAKMTPFGETQIIKEALIFRKYLFGDNGYEAGEGILQKMGLTTQMPTRRVIATNKAKNCIRKDAVLDIYVRPGKTNITAENKKYLQLLDAIELMDKTPVDLKQPNKEISLYIEHENLSYRKLIVLAGKYYNKKTLIRLAEIAVEDQK